MRSSSKTWQICPGGSEGELVCKHLEAFAREDEAHFEELKGGRGSRSSLVWWSSIHREQSFVRCCLLVLVYKELEKSFKIEIQGWVPEAKGSRELSLLWNWRSIASFERSLS